jgi:large subunit ribosomal protein L6
MSRIGKQAVVVPADVKIEVGNGTIKVEGKNGKLAFPYHPNMIVKYDAAAKQIVVERPNDDRLNRSLHGLTRSLINNAVTGVTKGFIKKLKIEGIGYQARIIDKKSIELSVGFANKIVLTPPEGVTVEVPDPKDPTWIVVKGADKQVVGQFAANIRASKKPEPYKGKGIRYETEVVRRKEGKSFASGG